MVYEVGQALGSLWLVIEFVERGFQEASSRRCRSVREGLRCVSAMSKRLAADYRTQDCATSINELPIYFSNSPIRRRM